MSKKYSICPIFIPHLGCTHACVFCNQHKITGESHILLPKDVSRYVESWQKTAPNTNGLAYYGGSFTALDKKLQEAYLKEASQLKQDGVISHLRLSTRPDALDSETIKRLIFYGVDAIEIGVQSLFDEVLLANLRGHSAKDSLEAIYRVKEAGLLVGAQMMVGLYQDTSQRSIQTAKKLSESFIDMVRIYPTLVLKETMLAKLYLKGDYVPWDREVLLDSLGECISFFVKKEIPIIRLGLQDEVHLQDNVLAGYYHPALGELAYSRYFRKEMLKHLPKDRNEVSFLIHSANLSKAIGQKRENITFFKEHYQIEPKFKIDDTLSRWEVRLCT